MKKISDSDYQSIIRFLQAGATAIRVVDKNLQAENIARMMTILRKKLIRNEKKNNCHRSGC